MKITFISNACAIFESSKGTKILSDPWIVDGVFDGSWCHFHPLETKLQDLQEIDAIYVSHVHPDHFDDRFFNFRKDIPIIVLDHGFNFLHKNLEKLGYQNLIKIKDNETKSFKDFKLTVFKPFSKHNFFEENTKVGNLIDSAIVFESDEQIVFNANDNSPNIEACKFLKERFEKIDLAMMNYNNAGPYPSCFDNLSEEEKKDEHFLNLERNINFLKENIKALKPKNFMPFAGAYVIGGKRFKKNDYLGTTTWDECAKRLKETNEIEANIICLRENDTFDLTSSKSNREYKEIDVVKMKDYIESSLSKIDYPYEKDENPNLCTLQKDLEKSIELLKLRIKKINLKPDMTVSIFLNKKEIFVCMPESPKGKLECRLDSRLLKRILHKDSHWNNAEIGCHIDFNRSPNYYSPDIHTMLQFLHL